MGMLFKDKAAREYFKSFLEEENKILTENQLDDIPANRQILIAKLDEVADEFGSSLPMINVIHHMKVMQNLRRLDSSQARERMDLAISAIREVEASGASERLGYDKIKAKKKDVVWKDLKLARAALYRDLGYSRLAAFYEDSAKHTNW